MPFADDAGGVAGPLEQRGHGRAAWFDEQPLDAGRDAGALLAERIFAGQERVARRRADRGHRVRVGEAQPLRGEPVHVGRLDFGRAVATEVAVADVIGQDEHDVGLARRLPRIGGDQYERQSPRQHGDGEGGAFHHQGSLREVRATVLSRYEKWLSGAEVIGVDHRL